MSEGKPPVWSIYAPMTAADARAALLAGAPDDDDDDDVDRELAAEVHGFAYHQGDAGYVRISGRDGFDVERGLGHARWLSTELAAPVYAIAYYDDVTVVYGFARGGDADAPETEAEVMQRTGFGAELTAAPARARAAETCVVEARSVAEVEVALRELYGGTAIPAQIRITAGPIGTVVEVVGDGHRGLAEELTGPMPDAAIYHPMFGFASPLRIERFGPGETTATWFEPGDAPYGDVLDEIRGQRTAHEILRALGVDPTRFGR